MKKAGLRLLDEVAYRYSGGAIYDDSIGRAGNLRMQVDNSDQADSRRSTARQLE
jgi:hypothetical protein